MLWGLLLIGLLAPPARPRIPPRPKPVAPAALPTSISITIKTTAGEVRTTLPPKVEPPATRQIAVLRAGETPEVRWAVRNTHPRNPINNVVVHFLITRQDALGAPIPNRPQKGSVVDTVFGTTIQARDANTGAYRTPIEEPGAYLVELELLDPQGNRRHYGALDLRVDP